jgi:hypothetical protein
LKLTMAGESVARDDAERHYDGGGSGEHAHGEARSGAVKDHGREPRSPLASQPFTLGWAIN